MARVTHVKKSVKSHTCDKCGGQIVKGSPYLWWKFRFGGKHVRCEKPTCAPTAADLTQSEWVRTLNDYSQRLTDALEELQDWLRSDKSDDPPGVDMAVGDLRGLQSEMSDYASEQESKRDNMPEGLQDGETGQLLENRATELESSANELDSAISTLEGIDVPSDWGSLDEEARETFSGELESAISEILGVNLHID